MHKINQKEYQSLRTDRDENTTAWLKLFEFIRRQARPIYLFILVCSLALGFAATGIKVDNSIEVWQTDGDVNWQHFQEFSKKHHLSDPLVILFPDLPYLKLKDMAQEFEQIPGVDRALSFTIFTLQKVESSVILLFPELESSPERLDEIISRINASLSRSPKPAYYLGGVWYLTAVLDELSSRSSASLFPVVLALMTIGVWLVFRNLKTTTLVLTCGVLPALWLTGIMALAGVKTNMVLLALPPLTMILGISHAIHFLLKDNSGQNAPLASFAKTIPPCLLSGLTTMLGFLSLCLSSYGPVRTLGFWGAVGVCLSFLITVLLLPGSFPHTIKKRSDKAWGQLTDFLDRHPAQLITLSAFFVILALGTIHLSRGSFILDFLKEDLSARVNHLAIETTGLGLTPLEVELKGVQIPSGQLSAILSELAEQEIVTHFLFFFGNDPYNFKAIATANGAEFDLPMVPGQRTEEISRMTVLTKTISSEETMAFADYLEDFLQKQFGTRHPPYVTGTVPLFTRGQDLLFNTLITSFSLAFFSISLIIGLVLRSVRLALIAIVPNLAPVILIIGVMGWTAIPLSVATVTVASIVFGVVVDDTIHFLHTWQQKKNDQDNTLEHLNNTLSHVGPAMLSTTLVAGVSFLGFVASPFVPLRNFGLLISLALALAILCDLVLLPMLFLRIGKNAARS